MLKKNKIIAGIVLYNPDINRLTENLRAICPQVDNVLLIENGSKTTNYLSSINRTFSNLVIIKNDKNYGIAYALNQILAYAYTNGCKWALTLDQDSVVAPNMINVYENVASDNVGIIGCCIEDRNFHDNVPDGLNNKETEVDWVISSASFTNVKAWKEVGGFDTNMFIDWVDWDICKAMKNAGYSIIKTYKTKLTHELANNAFLAIVFRKWRLILNRPAFRYYYVYRNRIYMARKYHDISMKSQLVELWWQTITCILYEQHKIQNLFAFMRGICDGFRMPIYKGELGEIEIKSFLNIQ